MLPFVPRAIGLALALALVSSSAAAHAQDAAPAASPTPPAAPTAAAVPVSPYVWMTLAPTGRAGRIEVLTSSLPRTTEERDDEDGWTTVCREPCGMWALPGTQLRVNGDFRASAPFSVPARPAVAVTAKPPSTAARAGAITLMAVSGAALAFTASLGFLLNVDLEGDRRNASERAADDRRNRIFLAAGGVSLGGLVAGFVLLRSVSTTPLELREGTSPAEGTARMPLAKGMAVSASGVHF